MGEALLKVLLVDDEPFILQGLKTLIDWEQEGFEVVKTAANGEEALEYLRGEQVDLIIADIKMPVVTGLELLEKIRGEKISDAHFVILSGYANFEYARKAIRYDCTDYILKPVDREELLKVLNKVQVLRRADNQKKQSSREMEQAYLSRHLIALIQGKFDSVNLEYVKSHMDGASGIRYVEIQMDDDAFSGSCTSIVLSSWDPMHHIVSLMSQRMRRFMTLGYCIVMCLLRSRGLMGKHI